MIESRSPEKCHYCDKPAEYNDLVGSKEDGFFVSGVCKKHVKQYGLS
jgi:hypothetical protein